MGRSPCCDESSAVKKGPWTPEEDEKLIDFINKHGHGSWRTLAKRAGLNRCGKSCRLRWTNYLRPDIKRGKFTEDEERIIINLHSVLGNKWSKIATHLPGRTDNEIKNFWNTHIRKKLLQMGIDPETHKPRTDYNHLMNLTQLLGMSNLGNPMSTWGNPVGLRGDVTQLAKLQLLQNLLQIMNGNSFVNMGNPYISGNLNLNPLNNAYIDGSNTLQTMEPVVLKSEEYVNHAGLFSQALSVPSQHGTISESRANIEGAPNPHVLDYYNRFSSTISHENQTENPLPALVASSPGTGTSFNQMDNICKAAQTSTQSPSNTIFDDWEKLLQDETCDWKGILDLTSTSAANSW